jgi:hypothetical protein
MGTVRRAVFLFLFTLLNSIMLMESAYAYLNPGTGGIWLQAVVAAIAGGLLFLQSYWHKFLNFFRNYPDTTPQGEREGGGTKDKA